MKLKCKQCHKEINQRAAKCPYCGSVQLVPVDFSNAHYEKILKKREKEDKEKGKYKPLLLLALIILGVWFFSIYQDCIEAGSGCRGLGRILLETLRILGKLL